GLHQSWAVVHDTYKEGRYSVYLHPFEGGGFGAETAIAATSKLQARPSCAYDLAGRLWIAYEEGPEQWGKDYGALAPNKGHPLYDERSVRVVCLVDSKLFRPAAALPSSAVKAPVAGDPRTTQGFEKATRYAS